MRLLDDWNLGQRAVVLLGGLVVLFTAGYALMPSDPQGSTTCGPAMVDVFERRWAYGEPDQLRRQADQARLDVASRLAERRAEDPPLNEQVKTDCAEQSGRRLQRSGVVASLAFAGTAGGVRLLRQ